MQLAKKQIALVAHFFLLTKRKFARAARIFVFLCRCFAWLQRCFERLQRQWLPSYTVFLWREELSYVLTQYFVSRLHVRFYFSLVLIYTLQAAPFWPPAILIFSPSLWIFMFFFLRNSSSSFSVIHLSVNIKYNVEKDTTLLLFFSQSPGGYVISFQIKPWVAHLSIELFYIGMPVVRTVGRAGHVTIENIKISRLDRLPNFLTHGAPLCALRARESFAINASRRCRKLNENSFVFVRILEKGDSDAL